MMQKLMNKKNKKGFTLIELIVVIAIIAILAAIAIPRFTGIQASSKLKADKATAAQMVSVARLIEADTSAAEGSTVSPVAGAAWTVSGTTYMNVPALAQSAAFPFVLGYASPRYTVSVNAVVIYTEP